MQRNRRVSQARVAPRERELDTHAASARCVYARVRTQRGRTRAHPAMEMSEKRFRGGRGEEASARERLCRFAEGKGVNEFLL